VIPDAAVEAAAPWIAGFLKRRGLELRGKEASALAGYVLEAAAPHMLAEAWDEGFDRGFYDPLAGSSKDASESVVANPYERTAK